MSTLGNKSLTLLEWAKRRDPDGKAAVVAELLTQKNDILEDIPWQEGNLPTGHRTTVRTGLPTVGLRQFNGGTQVSKSATAQIEVGCSMIDAWSEIDVALANLGGNPAGVRLTEGMAFLEAMRQEFASMVFYGNSKITKEEFSGLAIQYSDVTADNRENIFDAAGSGGDNTSVWLVGWGDSSVFGVFPQGSKAGLQHEDLGVQTIENAGGVTGARMRAYQEHWMWDCGLVIKDWRFASRIGSIDVSNLVAKSSAADLSELMLKQVTCLPSLTSVRPVFYMNRTVFRALAIQRRDDVISGGGITYPNVDGVLVPHFMNIPIHICDAILNSEDAI